MNRMELPRVYEKLLVDKIVELFLAERQADAILDAEIVGDILDSDVIE